MLFSLIQNTIGTVRFEIWGMYAARFLMSCMRARIPLWDIQADDTGQRITATVRLWDFPRLHDPARACAVRLHITERRGLLFTLRRSRGRVALWAGIPVILAVFRLLTGFVWSIDVIGNDAVSRAQILRALEGYGFAIGTPVDAVDAEYLRNEILSDNHDLSWLTVRLRGSHATVEVRERVHLPPIVRDREPCDVVAGASGLITLMRVRDGHPLVAEDQLVEAGEVLVSGRIPYPEYVTGAEGSLPVHASAEVYARVWDDIVCTAPLEAAQKVPTGAEHHRFALEVGTFRVNFSLSSSIDTPECDKIVKRTRRRLFPGLTVTLVHEILRPYDRAAASSDPDALTRALTDAASARLSQALAGSRITPVSVRTFVGENHARARVTVETVRDIAVTVER